MALIKPIPPAASIAAFSAQLPAFLWGPGGLVNPVSVGSAPVVPTAAQVIGNGPIDGQQVFVLSITDAATNTGVINPALAGWQFFAGDSNPKVASLVLGKVVQVAPSAWKLIAVYYGPIIAEEADALASLKNLGQPSAANYEVRALEVPGLNFKAFWLKALASGMDDLIIPNPTGSGQLIQALSSAPFYTMANFLAAIRPLAVSTVTTPAGYGA